MKDTTKNASPKEVEIMELIKDSKSLIARIEQFLNSNSKRKTVDKGTVNQKFTLGLAKNNILLYINTLLGI